MRNRNTMEPLEYLGKTLLWTIVAMIWYRNIFFIALPGCTIAWSKALLWMGVIFLTLWGWTITRQKRSNAVSVLVNVLFPYEIYTVLAYRAYFPRLVWGTVLGSVLLSTLFFVLAIWPDKEPSKITFEQRLRHGLLGARTLVTVCLLCLLIPLGVRLLFGESITTETPPMQDETTTEEDAWAVQNHMDTIRLLRPEKWTTLSTQEKMDALRVIINIEIHRLGLNHPISLRSAVLEGDVAAYYDNANHEIVIDMEHLQSVPAERVLTSICHECYHSYQCQMIELYYETPEEYRNMMVFRDVDEYIAEFSDYIHADENASGYYYQTVEVSAREYAAQAASTYYQLLESDIDITGNQS